MMKCTSMNTGYPKKTNQKKCNCNSKVSVTKAPFDSYQVGSNLATGFRERFG